MLRPIAVLLALVIAVAGACGDDKKTVEVLVDDLRPGDCFEGSPRAPEGGKQKDRNVLVVAGLPCSKSHEKEVFAVFEHPAEPGALFPGDGVTKVAQDGCAERFAGYVGRAFEDSKLQVSVIAPGPEIWNLNERTIVCTIQGDTPLKGSQKAGGG
jgi:hypothetical protein